MNESKESRQSLPQFEAPKGRVVEVKWSRAAASQVKERIGSEK